jgi:hypothetical protein
MGHLQKSANDEDEQFKDNCQQWKHFKRHLEDLEQATEHDHFGK